MFFAVATVRISDEEPAGRKTPGTHALFRLFAFSRLGFFGIFRLRQEFELNFARARTDGFFGVVAGEFLERATQDVIAVVAFGLSRPTAELALEFIPDTVELARCERDVVPLDIGLEEKLVQENAVVAVGFTHP